MKVSGTLAPMFLRYFCKIHLNLILIWAFVSYGLYLTLLLSVHMHMDYKVTISHLLLGQISGMLEHQLRGTGDRHNFWIAQGFVLSWQTRPKLKLAWARTVTGVENQEAVTGLLSDNLPIFLHTSCSPETWHLLFPPHSVAHSSHNSFSLLSLFFVGLCFPPSVCLLLLRPNFII